MDGQYLIAKQKNIYFVKLIGSVKYTISEPFDKFLQKIFEESDFDDIVVDLTKCEFLDSTNLGLVAKIASFCKRKFHRKTILYSTNPEINILLKNIGFYRIFNIMDETQDQIDDFEKLESVSGHPADMAKTILDAHKELASLSDKNKEIFKSVIDMFEKNIQES